MYDKKQMTYTKREYDQLRTKLAEAEKEMDKYCDIISDKGCPACERMKKMMIKISNANTKLQADLAERNQLLKLAEADLAASKEQYKDLHDTVQISCNPPDDCNDPKVLKTYMKACFEQAQKGDLK